MLNKINFIKNQSFSINEQVRNYSSELWSLVATNNILERQTVQADVGFDDLISTLSIMNKTILNNVSLHFQIIFL